MLFDGQHKAAAQLYNQCDGLLCRVFLAPWKAVGEEFAKFLDELGATDIPVELVGRLRKTILEDQVITEGAVKAALSTTKTP